MFACCARGEDMFDENNLESSIFKKLFPEVPLVGCIGDGEFGTNTLSSGKLFLCMIYLTIGKILLKLHKTVQCMLYITESSNERKKWYNQITTVFLIITYT